MFYFHIWHGEKLFFRKASIVFNKGKCIISGLNLGKQVKKLQVKQVLGMMEKDKAKSKDNIDAVSQFAYLYYAILFL